MRVPQTPRQPPRESSKVFSQAHQARREADGQSASCPPNALYGGTSGRFGSRAARLSGVRPDISALQSMDGVWGTQIVPRARERGYGKKPRVEKRRWSQSVRVKRPSFECVRGKPVPSYFEATAHERSQTFLTVLDGLPWHDVHVRKLSQEGIDQFKIGWQFSSSTRVKSSLALQRGCACVAIRNASLDRALPCV